MFKNFILWRYGRTTWQYDVVCVLILAFIFLTPRSWFDERKSRVNSEPRTASAHRNRDVSIVVLPIDNSRIDDNSNRELNAAEIEERLKSLAAESLSGRAEVKVKNVRPQRDEHHRITAYEIDIE